MGLFAAVNPVSRVPHSQCKLTSESCVVHRHSHSSNGGGKMRKYSGVLVAVLCLQIAVSAVSARTILELGTSKTVNADFKNVFAKGVDNEVSQDVQIIAPDNNPAPGPEAVGELTAADFQPRILDPYNPSCTLSDKDDYIHFSVTKHEPVVAKKAEVRAFRCV